MLIILIQTLAVDHVLVIILILIFIIVVISY